MQDILIKHPKLVQDVPKKK